MSPHSEYGKRMERAYERAIRWATARNDTRQLQMFQQGLAAHRQFMRGRH